MDSFINAFAVQKFKKYIFNLYIFMFFNSCEIKKYILLYVFVIGIFVFIRKNPTVLKEVKLKKKHNYKSIAGNLKIVYYYSKI